MSFDKPRHRETKPDRTTPDNQRAVLLDALRGTIVDNWQELAAEVLAAGQGRPMRLLVTCTGWEAREEIGCDFDRADGWVFVWLWEESKPQRIGRAGNLDRVARTVASVMGIRTVTV